MKIEQIEARFKSVTGLQHLDLSKPHYTKEELEGIQSQQKTSAEDQKKFGYVTTPIWLVDEMIEPEMKTLDLTKTTGDVCAGCGQMTIRMMRKLYTKYPKMDVGKWLKNNHCFVELQYSNVARLVYIFGPNINVYAGDALMMKYSIEEEDGILFFDHKKKRWFNVPVLKQLIEPIKDNLPSLLNLFRVLEKKYPPQVK